MTSQTALDGVTVVDVASLYAGPVAAMMLGDFGADVIKVEHPSGGALRDFGPRDDSVSWDWVNRNKRSVTLDLHDDDSRSAFEDLVESADVLIESFRPGTLEEWDIGWESLSERNPGLVMARTTGFGQTGPYSNRPGFGTLVEAMSGFAFATGQPDGPPTLPPMALADMIAALHSAYGIMVALYNRDTNGGTGQYIDVSILESMFGVLGDHVSEYATHRDLNRRSGNRSERSAPRNTYQTKDGRWVAISGSTQSVTDRILRIVGGDELANDPRFETNQKRLDNIETLDELIQEWMGAHTRSEIIEIFDEHEAPIGPVFNMADIFEDEHFASREAIVSPENGEQPPMRGVFPRLSETPGEIRSAGPDLGADTRDVLAEYTDLSTDRIARIGTETGGGDDG